MNAAVTTGGQVNVHPVTYGKARDKLMGLIAEAKSEDKLAPVTVIMPTRSAVAELRRYCAAQGKGIAAVHFTTLHDLVHQWVLPEMAAAGRHVASDTVVGAAVRQVLCAQGGTFAEIADHPSTQTEFVRVYKELRGLTDEVLEELRKASDRASKLVDISNDVTKKLYEYHYYDYGHALDAATETLTDEDKTDRRQALLELNGPLVLFLLTRLTSVEDRLLEELAAKGHQVEKIEGESEIGEAKFDEVLDVSDADEEVRHVVRRVLADIDSGVPASEVYVFLPSHSPYASILSDHLQAAGLAWDGITTQTLAGSVAGRFVLGLLDLTESNLPRKAVLDLLALGVRGRPKQPEDQEAPEGKKGKAGEDWIPLAWWERLAREARVVGGKDWTEGMTSYSDKLQERSRQREGDGDEQSIAAEGDAAEVSRSQSECLAMAEFMEELQNRVNEVKQLSGWRDIASWLERQMRDYLPKSLSGVNPSYLGSNQARHVQALASVGVREVVRELGGLPDFDDPVSVNTFRNTLKARLGGTASRGPATGTGVNIKLTEHGGTLLPKRAYVLGLAEGVYPTRVSPDSILGDADRDLLEGKLTRVVDRVATQRHALLAIVDATKQNDGNVVGVFPRGSLRRTTKHVHSRWLTELLPNDEPDGTSSTRTVIASFRQGILTADFPASTWEYDCKDIVSAGWDKWSKKQGKTDPRPLPNALARAREMTEKRQSTDFTRFDGNLDGILMPADQLGHQECQTAMSATSLESWVECPRSYLFSHLLGVRPSEDADNTLEISALDYGRIVHTALEEICRVYHTASTVAGKDKAAWDEQVEEHMKNLQYETYFGNKRLWKFTKSQINGDLHKFFDKLEQRSGEVGEFFAAEAKFDDITYEINGAKTRISFRGSIDRVEVGEDGRYTVLDYKTGSSSTTQKAMDADATVGGTLLQLPIYAWAIKNGALTENCEVIKNAEISEGIYWFVSSRKGKWRVQKIQFEKDVWHRFRDVMANIQKGMASGVFIAKPPREDNRDGPKCQYCDPDDLGSRVLYGAYNRKKDCLAQRNNGLESLIELLEASA